MTQPQLSRMIMGLYIGVKQTFNILLLLNSIPYGRFCTYVWYNHLLSAYNDQPTSNLLKVKLLYINPWLGLMCLIWFLVFANYCSDWNNLAGRSLANIPPSERPKAKPSRKIDGKGAKKSQLQAALQQHSQQLAQLQQLQQLNQQLQQQVSL